MKDSNRNMADLIGALAEDMEEIKTKLGAIDVSDKDGTLRGLVASLEPVIRFFGGGAPEIIGEIFGSGEAVEDFKRSLCDDMVANLQAHVDAADKDMRDKGVPSVRELLYRILETQTILVKNRRPAQDMTRRKRGFWRAIRPGKAISAARRLWGKVPDGWYKNPYAWAGVGCALVFTALFAVSWVQWNGYREENRRLRTVEDKHHVTTIMLDELYPELAVTLGAYEELVDAVGVDSTLAIFDRQVKIMRDTENQPGQR